MYYLRFSPIVQCKCGSVQIKSGCLDSFANLSNYVHGINSRLTHCLLEEKLFWSVGMTLEANFKVKK